MPKLNSTTAGNQTADPWVIGIKPNALTSDDCLKIDLKKKYYNLYRLVILEAIYWLLEYLSTFAEIAFLKMLLCWQV